MKHAPRSVPAIVQRMRLSVLAQACLAAIVLNTPAWSQAVSMGTAAGQFTAKSGNAALVSGLPQGQTVIRLENNKSVLEWVRLNVAQGNSLQFIQPNTQSVVLNRVTGSDPTRIDGSLLSNGHVWLLNPSGVLFGANSTVNVQSLLATTRTISDAEFLTQQFHFAGGGSGPVSSAGVISVGEGGYVVLAGQRVENTGSIQAQLGQVHLASGKAFALDLNGDKLLRFDVTQALSPTDASEAIAKNTGSIVADGGRVQITARAANGLVGQVVNTGGLLQANSVRTVNGEIVIDAGPGGSNTLGGTINAQGLEASTRGGNITALGENIRINSDARISASGQTGGGNVLVGGDWQGSGSLQQAKTVAMQQGAEIKANATANGDGGKVVLWSDVKAEGGSTSFSGRIEAMAGPSGGQGGKVETSGHQLLVAASGQVNASSPKGVAGQWLLDPVDVTIDAAAATSIENALNTNYVLVTTAGSSTPANVNPFTSVRVGESGSDGNIYVNAPMTWNKYVLSLEAHGNVFVNAPITLGAIDNTFNPGTFGGISIRTGYSTPAVNGGTFDATKVLLFGKTNTGFTGNISINDASGVARNGFGFRLNDNDYTLIKNLTGLQSVSSSLNGKYALSGSIDATASSGLNAGAGFDPLGNALGAFTGTFNGLGNTITNLTINRSNTDLIGLFGSTNGATISNVGLVSANFSGQGQVGGLIGQMKNGLLLNSFSRSAQLTGLGEVGGLVGQLTVDDTQSATLKSNFFQGSITGTTGGSVGGAIGLIYSANSNSNSDILIQNNFADSSVTTASNNSSGFLGAVALYGAANVKIFDNFSKGSVTSTADGIGGFLGSADLNACAFGCRPVGRLNLARNYANVVVSGRDGVGGFGGSIWNGYSDSSFSNNYATGNVTAAANGAAGGFIGYNQVPQLYSYATGSVTGGSPKGGLIGRNWADLTHVYWNTTSSGISTGIGTETSGIVSIQGLTADEMTQQVKFNGFDFASGSAPWFIYEGHSLPLLRGFLTPLTVTVSGPSSQIYNGTNVYSGAVLSYSVTPDNSLIFGSNSYALASKNVGAQTVSINSGLYSNQSGYLISTVNNVGTVQVTPAALSVTANSVTKTYDGSTTAGGSGTVASLAGAGAGESVNSAGTQSFLDKNAGTNKTVRAAGVTIKDSGNADVTGNYNITYVDANGGTITPAALLVKANSSSKTYDGTTNASGVGSVDPLAGAGAGESVNSAGTQSFLDKNAGTNKTVRAAGVTIKDSGNADVTGNYNITYVDANGGTITPASLSVAATGINKDYDGNTSATVTTTDNRIGNDVLTIATSANFADPFVAANKPVTVSSITLSGTDAANYTLANTTASTTASINASQTTAAVQVAASASLPSVTPTNVFAAPVLVSPTAANSSAANATSTNASSNASRSVSTTSDEPTTTTAANANSATSATTTVTAVNASTTNSSATISVNTQTVAPSTAVAVTQATTASQNVAITSTSAANANTSAQVQIVSLSTTSARTTPAVGAQTIAPVQTPKSAEDQTDPVLAAVSSFKPAAPASTSNRAPTRGRDAPVVVPLVQGVLVMETTPPKAATQAVDEQRLSASGDRSRW